MKIIVPGLHGPAGKHATGQLVRYGIVVGCGYLLAIGAYSAELSLGVPPYAGLGIAFVINGMFNFALLRLWAFPPSGRSLRSDLMRFCIVAAVSFLVNYASFAFLYSLAALSATTAQQLGIIIAAPVTFLANRTWSFGTRSSTISAHDGGDTPASVKKESYSRI